jgi:clathrin heavy chain
MVHHGPDVSTAIGVQSPSHTLINYRVTPDEKWLLLIGMSSNMNNPSTFKVNDPMHLYSRDRGVGRLIDGNAAAFAEIKQGGHRNLTKLFSFAVRTATGAKVCPLVTFTLYPYS